jgi:hypothetical protein
MIKAVCQELAQYVDWDLTDVTVRGETERLGALVYDRRRVVFAPIACLKPLSHRVCCTFDAMARSYNRAQCRTARPLECLHCRMCSLIPTAWVGRARPSGLEQEAYALADRLCSPSHHIYYEWHVPTTRRSIDLVLIRKDNPSRRGAVHVDGRQHTTHAQRAADAAFDALLMQQGFEHVLRLTQSERSGWAGMLTRCLAL